jgi:peptidoglycan LD-endopeptidase CwlK
MSFRPGKLSRSRLEGLPQLVRVVERAIQDHDPGFRIQEGVRTRERQAELVARGASRIMHSRHLTGHAVDLVALDGGEVSWQWVAAVMQAFRLIVTLSRSASTRRSQPPRRAL